ncbi:hypothetical protein TELCIR_22318 [Teladorsagia circumcincta]|uniref:GTP-binding protein LepA C-terminal domain-containing protein n=1 Tax=Teladorsagia circumcincta TaxID=45464 RepID=A0A2G9TE95_TELCI|nr:hypothetical protein TELCIR_22318 [Teladorsagia circumcincta]
MHASVINWIAQYRRVAWVGCSWNCIVPLKIFNRQQSEDNWRVPEFSQIIPAAMAQERAKLLVHRLKREIPRQQFEVTIKGKNKLLPRRETGVALRFEQAYISMKSKFGGVESSSLRWTNVNTEYL